MSTTPSLITFDPNADDPRPSEFLFGLSLGSAGGRTALVAVEKSWGPGGSRLDVLDAKRWPARTGYPVVVGAVGRVLARPEARPFLDVFFPRRGTRQVERFVAPPPRLIIDGSQAGPGVVGMFLDAGLAGEVTPAKVTGGTECSEHRWPGRPDVTYWHVARIALVAAIQAALQGGRLSFNQSMAERSALVAELGNFTSKAVARNSEDFVAEREGDADDISLALGAAVWLADRPPAGEATWGGDPLGDDWW